MAYGGLSQLPPDQKGVMRGDLFTMANIEWLWQGYIPAGCFSLLAGETKVGKGTVLARLSASLTAGREWPDGAPGPEPCELAWVAREEDFASIVAPRLHAAGCDLSKVYSVDPCVKIKRPDGKLEYFPQYFTDLDYWRDLLESFPGLKAIIADPIATLLGESVNDHRSKEVRTVLEPFVREITTQYGVALIGTHHLGKRDGTILDRVYGSIAYASIPRAVLGVAIDPADQNRRHLGVIRSNLSEPVPCVAFGLEGHEFEYHGKTIKTVRAADQGTTDSSLDDLTGPVSLGAARRRNQIERATDWLRERLKDHPLPSEDVARDGDANLGEPWELDRIPEERQDQFINGRIKWWRERILKDGLGGESRKYGQRWYFTLSGQDWPPPAHVTDPVDLEALV
jgi:putative DNA primase/helicase